MEITVRCRKEGEEWTLEPMEPVLVTDYGVTWRFEGLEPGIVPLLAFDGNQPFGPFETARFSDAGVTGRLADLPAAKEDHPYRILLVQWRPEGSAVVARLDHALRLLKPRSFVVLVRWHGIGTDPVIDPLVLKVGGGCQVEWVFDVPGSVFTSIDFQRSSPKPGEPRPLGPFPELLGENVKGSYRLRGWTDGRAAVYKYAVSFYDRDTGTLITRPDPQIDNNGDPPDGSTEG